MSVNQHCNHIECCILLATHLTSSSLLQDVREDEGEDGNKKNQIVRISRGGRSLSPDPDSFDEGENDMADLEARIKAANMPEEARKVSRLRWMGECRC